MSLKRTAEDAEPVWKTRKGMFRVFGVFSGEKHREDYSARVQLFGGGVRTAEYREHAEGRTDFAWSDYSAVCVLASRR